MSKPYITPPSPAFKDGQAVTVALPGRDPFAGVVDFSSHALAWVRSAPGARLFAYRSAHVTAA